MKTSSNNDAMIAVILMYIGLWLFGVVIASGFMTIAKSFDPTLKNKPLLRIIMILAWDMYCFFKGYLKWLSVKNYYQHNNQ